MRIIKGSSMWDEMYLRVREDEGTKLIYYFFALNALILLFLLHYQMAKWMNIYCVYFLFLELIFKSQVFNRMDKRKKFVAKFNLKKWSNLLSIAFSFHNNSSYFQFLIVNWFNSKIVKSSYLKKTISKKNFKDFTILLQSHTKMIDFNVIKTHWFQKLNIEDLFLFHCLLCKTFNV